ncbi:protein-L-isoaspartate O-methyltransferase [Reyranella sp. CPCC 100927]|uniref:protein-L-isoaspartate O-methyltransferase family protein n=1 Tax=Reyranella sp. CPCC 100927 TaxID=2599616 RepID=UPI0011B6FF36|nr:protein-L-isoaspartate O-methyltransferase [Reyranella sp. CPCC 100927]TWT10641.1 protein-L-isoaspartate O-methyltransferase [Reyranella sp. CPCC 100927]
MPTDFALARRNMVEGQLRPNQIVHPVLLDALAALPRERFLPDARAALAYADEAVPLGEGRYLMEPTALARLVQMTQPGEKDRALVVGAGPGYGAAVLGRLVASVVALECDAALAQRARSVLPALGTANVSVVEGPLAAGHAAKAPYDIILIEGAVPAIPDTLTAQLAEEGRLVAIVGGGVPGYPGQAHLGRKVGGVFSSRPVFDAGTPALPGFAAPARFVF